MRGRRWRGWAGVGLATLRERAAGGATSRIALSVLGVALAVALLVVVAGIALGFAGHATMDAGADYWVTPAGGAPASALVAADTLQFGDVHAGAERIEAIDGVVYATPVLLEVVAVDAGGEAEHVVAVGVIDHPELEGFLGLPTRGLTPGDPHFAGGPWTGEVVASASAGARLGVDAGDRLVLEGDHAATVVDVAPGEAALLTGELPVVVMHLSELQAVTGADAGDRADQFLVRADGDVAEAVGGIYPDAQVHTRSDLLVDSLVGDDRALAMAVTSLLVAVVVGALFVVTTMGLEVVTDRGRFATLAAMGVPYRARLGVVAVETAVVTGLGGVLGVGLGWLGIALVNAGTRGLAPGLPVAVAHPGLALYALGATVLIAALALPYVAYVLARIDATEVLA